MNISLIHEQWHAQKIFMGDFIQWHIVVICIWCALFVTSKFDVIYSSGLRECAGCAKWGSHFQFTRFVGAPIFSSRAFKIL